jgi:hypothetical protein
MSEKNNYEMIGIRRFDMFNINLILNCKRNDI